MAVFLLVRAGKVIRQCEAPDRETATARLLPLEGGRVVSAASYALDGAANNVVQRCVYGCGRPSVPDQKGCAVCTAQRARFRVARP